MNWNESEACFYINGLLAAVAMPLFWALNVIYECEFKRQLVPEGLQSKHVEGQEERIQHANEF